MLRRYRRWAVLGAVIASIGVFGDCSTDNIPLIAIEVNPLCVVLKPGGTAQFDATLFVDSVDQGVDNSAVSWSVLGGDINGVVSSSGFYQAPNTNPPPASQIAIIATSNEDDQKQGQATVILTPTPTPVPNPCEAPPFS